MSPVRLDDQQIERYSRQIILAEVGPAGQARLLEASVGVIGEDVAAACVVAYLAAAGVGRLAVSPALACVADPEQHDVTIVAPPEPDTAARIDAIVLCGGAARDASAWSGRSHVLWTSDGLAAELPPCFRCATSAVPRENRPGTATLTDVRDRMLGSVIATEVVKTLLGIGTPLRGRALVYEPERASVVTRAIATIPGCPVCDTRA